MTKRMLMLLIVVFTSLMFLTIGLLTAEEIEEESEEINIHNEGYKRKLFKPVLFTHLVHNEDYGIDCDECHHDYKGGENIWEEGDSVQNCVACHSPIKKQQKNVHRLVFAYHFNCKKCHIENEAGPVECKECHTKK